MSGAKDISVDDLLEARECLEVPAAGFAASRRDPRHVERMRQAVERDKQARLRGTKLQERRTFHAVLVEATRNQLIGMMSEPLFRVLQARMAEHTMPSEYWTRIDVEHTEICAFIEAGDVDGAQTAMRAHLGTVRRAYEKI
jgi:DNA-binding FadR family transcriptional regulator